MIDKISFTVPGVPVAKGRARSFVRNGHVAHYTPEKTANYENLVKVKAEWAMGSNPLIECAVGVDISLFVPIPKSWSKKKQNDALINKIRPTSKPDLDNYLKILGDALNGIVWHDDKQVVYVSAGKFYSDVPRAEIEIKAIEAA